MRDYELIYIIHPDLEEEDRVVLVDNVQEWITAEGGLIIKMDHWGRRRLAYLIQDVKDGYYVMMDLQLPPNAVRELERRFQLSEQVLRYLTVRKDS